MSDVYQAGETEGMSDRGGTLDGGPRAHVHRDSAEAPSCLSNWVFEGEECDCHRTARRKGEELLGEHFWARGYAVSTVGFELEQVRQYIREQDAADGNGQF